MRTAILIPFLLLFTLTGCGNPDPAPGQTPSTVAQPATHARSGTHGGALLPLGTDHVEIVYDEAQTRLVAYFFGADASSAKIVAPATLSAQVKVVADGAFQDVVFTPLPLDGETPERCSRFASAALALKVEFEIVVRLKTGETVSRAHALLDPGAVATSKFVCPMNCFDGKTYPLLGNCPKCGMKLVETMNGSQPHADHRPRHGGVFFMSADNWHHLEGVFAPPDEFRLYLYDNFTRPMDVSGFDANADFGGKSETLQPGATRAYLTAKIPAGSALPFRAAVRIKLKPDQPPELFNFSFSDWTPSPR